MGQAKRRGSLEERAADPKGDSWREVYWTEERLAAFKERMSKELRSYVDSVRRDLFSVSKKKAKRFRKIKTGG
jgi:hypothetical protein